MKHSLLLAAVMMCAALCGCGSGTTTAQNAEQPDPAPIYAGDRPETAQLSGLAVPASPPAAGLAASLPAPSELSRSSSFTIQEGTRLGSEFEASLPNNKVTDLNDTLIFAPSFESSPGDSFSDVSYAVYSFVLPDYNGSPVRFNLNWSDAPDASRLYAALADFPADRWKWFSLADNSGMTLPSISEHLDGSDNLHLVLAITGSDAAVLTNIIIAGQLSPVAVLTSDVDSGVAPLEVSFDASGSSDGDGVVQGFVWDFDGDGQFGEAGAESAAAGQSQPAAQTYAQTGSFNPAVRVTDNDGNTDTASIQINVSNSPPPVAQLSAEPLTGSKPLLVSFDATASNDPDGTITSVEWDFDGDGAFNEAGTAEESSNGDLDPPAVTYASVGDFTAVVRVTDNDGGVDTASVEISVSNTPPTAVMQSDVDEGDAPFDVSFTAELSSDPGGELINFEWDFDGDGLFGETGTAEETYAGLDTAPSVTYSKAGNFNAQVRVTDDDGETASAQIFIVAHGWDSFQIDADAGNAAATNVQLGLIGNKPAVAWISVNGSGLRYGSSSSFSGKNPADWTFISVPSNSGSEISLADVAGNPAFAAHSQSAGDLIYQRATGDGLTPAHWPSPVVVESSGNTGRFPELYTTATGPAILYWDSSNQRLRVASSADADGDQLADWSSFATIADAGGGESLFSVDSFGLTSGNPTTAYYFYDGASDHLRFERSSDSFGNQDADWGSFFDLDTDNGDGAWEVYGISAASGLPAVMYYDNSTFMISYALASNESGSAWNAPLGIISEADASSSVRFSVINALPCVAYQTQTGGDVKFIESTSSLGNNIAHWSNIETVETEGFVGSSLAMAQIDGAPALAYSDSTAHTVRFAVRY